MSWFMQSLQTPNPSGIIYMTKNDNMVTRFKKKKWKGKKKEEEEEEGKEKKKQVKLIF